MYLLENIVINVEICTDNVKNILLLLNAFPFAVCFAPFFSAIDLCLFAVTCAEFRKT